MSFQLNRIMGSAYNYYGVVGASPYKKRGIVSPIFCLMAKEMLLPICTVQVRVAQHVWGRT
jgi:hypothetical protein